MASTGLLGQLPDLGQLEQLRDLAGNGLDTMLRQVTDPASLLSPLTDALEPVTSQVPDLAGLIQPLSGQLDRLVQGLPSDLDQLVAAILPLLSQAEQVINTGVLQPIVDDLRAGRSINEIAQDQLQTIVDQQLLSLIPGLRDGALPAGAQSAVDGLLSAANGFSGGTPDPALLGDFLAQHVLGMPVGPLDAATAARARFFGVLDGMLVAVSQEVIPAQQGLAGQLAVVATRLENLDPSQAGDWQAVLSELQQARSGLDRLCGALQALPGVMYGGLAQLDPQRYREELRQALQGLAAAGAGGGRFATLDGLADDILRPLDELTEATAAMSPAIFSSGLRSALDTMLGLFDTMADAVQHNPVFDFFDDVQQVVDTIAGAFGSVRAAIEGALRTLVGVIATVAGEFNTVKQQVEAAFQSLQKALDQIDVDALVQAVESALGQLNDLVAAIPLDQLKNALDQALSTVEGLVKTLGEVASGALEQVETLAGALEQIRFEPLVEPVIDAINAIKDTLSAIDPDLLPEAVKDLLRQAIDAFKQQFDGDIQSYFKVKVVDSLNAAFEKAVESVRDLVQSLQNKLNQFDEAVGKLDPKELLKPLLDVFQELNQAIAGLSGQSLLAPVGRLLDEARQALQALSPAQLLAPLEEAFENTILEPLQQFQPSQLLQPLIEAFEPLEELIAKLDFSEAFRGMSEAAGGFLGSTQQSLVGALDFSGLSGTGGTATQVQPILDLLRPATSTDDWTGAMTEMLASYRPSNLLQPIQVALSPVENVLAGASDDLLLATFGRLQALTQATQVANGAATASAFSGQLEQIASELQANTPAQLIAGLHAPHARLQAALSQVDPATLPPALRPQYDAVQAALAALDPASCLGRLEGTLAPLADRVRQAAARPLDLHDLEASFGTSLGVAAGALPGFLFEELTPDTVRQGLAAFSPTALIQRIDVRYDAFLNAAQRFGPAIQAAVEGFVDQLGLKLTEISPAALFERFAELFQPIRDALQAISPRAMADTLDQAYEEMMQSLAQVHPRVIREPAQALFDAVLAKLDEVRTRLVGAVSQAIDQVLERIRATLAALDPQALVIGLGNLFALLRQELEGLDLTAMLDRLAQIFERLRADLAGALQRSADAIGQMVEAMPA